jgi:hypothetical protein
LACAQCAALSHHPCCFLPLYRRAKRRSDNAVRCIASSDSLVSRGEGGRGGDNRQRRTVR